MKKTHVVSARAFDELGGLCGDELLAEVFIDLNFDDFYQFGGSFRSGGQVDVEGHFLGAVVHFFHFLLLFARESAAVVNISTLASCSMMVSLIFLA